MTLQRQIGFWIGALLFAVLVLWLLSPILLPFLAGLALAYFLDPVADWLERRGLPRLAATTVILIAAVMVVVLALVVLIPMVGNQLARLAADLPNMLKGVTVQFNQVAPQWLKELIASTGTDVQGNLSDIVSKGLTLFVTLFSSVISGSMAVVNVVSLLIVTPIVAFYLLADWDRMVAVIDGWLPRDHAETIRAIFRDIDTSLAGFIRGQGTVCLLLGAFYAVGLSLAGLKFGLAIGIVAGALTFIPYAGALIGGVLAIGVAIFQFMPDYMSILIVVGVFALGQFIEGNILSPKLVGGSIGLHPVWLMFALFAFGYIFGFVGLLMAVPLAAVTGVLVRFALAKYLHSRLYLGTAKGPEALPPPALAELKKPAKRRAK